MSVASIKRRGSQQVLRITFDVDDQMKFRDWITKYYQLYATVKHGKWKNYQWLMVASASTIVKILSGPLSSPLGIYSLGAMIIENVVIANIMDKRYSRSTNTRFHF